MNAKDINNQSINGKQNQKHSYLFGFKSLTYHRRKEEENKLDVTYTHTIEYRQLLIH